MSQRPGLLICFYVDPAHFGGEFSLHLAFYSSIYCCSFAMSAIVFWYLDPTPLVAAVTLKELRAEKEGHAVKEGEICEAFWIGNKTWIESIVVLLSPCEFVIWW